MSNFFRMIPPLRTPCKCCAGRKLTPAARQGTIFQNLNGHGRPRLRPLWENVWLINSSPSIWTAPCSIRKKRSRRAALPPCAPRWSGDTMSPLRRAAATGRFKATLHGFRRCAAPSPPAARQSQTVAPTGSSAPVICLQMLQQGWWRRPLRRMCFPSCSRTDRPSTGRTCWTKWRNTIL